MSYALPILLLIPLIGAVLTATLVPPTRARSFAFWVSILTAAAAVWIAWGFDYAAGGVQYKMEPGVGGNWSLESIGFSVHLGVDAIGLWLILLTVLLMPSAIVASEGSIKVREREYYAWMLALLAVMLGVFVSRDALLFYVFFELTLVPMFFIIGIWGGPKRREAAGRFFLFTFAGGVLTLTAIVYMGIKTGSFDLSAMIETAQLEMGRTERLLVFLGLLAGFAVKVPLFPVHTWLPLAHTEAPTAGSVILAGVLLKLGTYGLLQVAAPIGLVARGQQDMVMFPGLLRVLGALCVIAVIYGALVAWVQKDIKKLVAYSSVSHLGFCVLGLVAMNDIGLQGSVLYMINHGLSTGAMFLCIGMIYDRLHTRDIDELSGLGKTMPVLAFFFVFFMLSSIGLPGLNGFVSELLTVLGAFTSPHLGIEFGAIAAVGVVLGAIYMLHMTARVIFGPLKYPGHAGDGSHASADAHGYEDRGAAGSSGGPGFDPHAGLGHGHVGATDITPKEVALLVPIAVAVLVLGVYPSVILRTIRQPLQQIRTGEPAAMVAVESAGSNALIASADAADPREARHD